MTRERRWQGQHARLTLRRITPGLVVLVLEGRDAGEFGEEPFEELARDMGGGGPVELFIDARAASAAGLEVSARWALWLGRHRAVLGRVCLLTGAPFITLTADVVKSFSGLGELMHVYTNPADFDVELARTASRLRRQAAASLDAKP